GNKQTHLPMPRVQTKRDGRAVLCAQASMRAQDEELWIEQPPRVPAHACVLRQAEQIARRLRQEHLGRNGKCARRATRVRGDGGVDRWIRFKHLRGGKSAFFRHGGALRAQARLELSAGGSAGAPMREAKATSADNRRIA